MLFARKEPKTEGDLIADLDQIVQGSGKIKLHNKIHKVNPVLLEEFLGLSHALGKIREIDKAEKVTSGQLIDAYYDLISPVVPTLTKEDLRSCTHSQIAMLLQKIIEFVTGGMTDEKKKQMRETMLPTGLR